MKDFISRLTFGFLMAQLFPGAVVVFALTFAYLSFEGLLPNGVLGGVERVLDTWQGGNLAEKLFLAGLLIAFGMLIHGIHWTVLGTLEDECSRTTPRPETMFDFPRDRHPLVVQLLIGPFRIAHELGLVVIRPLRRAAVRENVSAIDDPWMKQHEFMQDFYLYTAQFFAHTSYALLVCLSALSVFMLQHGNTWRRDVLLALIYLASSTFFVLSRVQFVTLFAAERELIQRGESIRTAPSPAPPEPPLRQCDLPGRFEREQAVPPPPRRVQAESACAAITSTLRAFTRCRG